MFCRYCGHELHMEDSFCPQCGKPAGAAPFFPDGYGSHRRQSCLPFNELIPFLSKTACFRGKGRASRAEYVFFLLFGAVYLGVLYFITFGLVPEAEDTLMGWILLIVARVFEAWYDIAFIALSIRRAHDMGMSGWISIGYVVPLINVFIVLFMACKGSDGFYNSYGAPVDYTGERYRFVSRETCRRIWWVWSGSIVVMLALAALASE